jgi:hypothetical protein
MTWTGVNFLWSRARIISHVPPAAGVYAIWRSDAWIYVGETTDLLVRLLEHFEGNPPCIARQEPTAFGFELVPGEGRVARQNWLISQLRPLCNS